MADSDVVTISKADLRGMIRETLREELRAVGFRTDDAAHSEQLRDDIRFAGRLRSAVEGTASKIGMAIVLAIVGGLVFLVQLGASHLMRGGSP